MNGQVCVCVLWQPLTFSLECTRYINRTRMMGGPRSDTEGTAVVAHDKRRVCSWTVSWCYVVGGCSRSCPGNGVWGDFGAGSVKILVFLRVGLHPGPWKKMAFSHGPISLKFHFTKPLGHSLHVNRTWAKRNDNAPESECVVFFYKIYVHKNCSFERKINQV